ncbi:MAG TPA: RidA family protein [Armatimonadota bacterium]|nr:RidA family protein [Armatimonadota bacterium]
MLVANPHGDYHFLPGSEPYSSGVVADPGFEIVHVTLLQPPPYQAGFDFIAEHLRGVGRPRAALCGVELRSPAPFTRDGFLQFNEGYQALLREWNLLVDGQNPVARTNVAPEWNPPSEPALFGFSYTAPVEGDVRPTYVVAGAGELRGGTIGAASVIRPGETSADAMREKAAYVMKVMHRRLTGLGQGWESVTAVNVYTAQAMDAVLGSAVLDIIGPATGRGVCWYHARPPIAELEYEMDLRGVRTERHL